MAKWMLAAVVLAGAAFPQAAPTPLEHVRRICVDSLVGSPGVAGPARELAFAALFRSRRFTVLEACGKADATLKGAVTTTSDIRSRSESEGIGFGVGAARADFSGGSAGVSAGSNGESLSSTEQSRAASVSLRLVNSEGEVVWAYTQDSPAGKTLSAPALAMDRAIRQLLREAGPAPAASK